MGFFVNMLPMRMQIDPEQRMGAWLDQVHHMVVESFSYLRCLSSIWSES